MSGGSRLSDGVITLRAVESGDIQRLYEWRNDSATRSMFRDSRPLDLETHRGFVRKFVESEVHASWLIVEISETPVGTISLYNFSADSRECDFGRFIIAPEHRGSGYGRRALSLLVDFARSLGVRRMRCEVLASNECALHLYESLGFHAVGEEVEAGRNFVRMEAELGGK